MRAHDREPQQTPRGGFGQAVDEWTPRVLKLLGCTGFALSLVLYPLGLFDPVVLGCSLAAASGGFTLDALNVIKPGKE